MRELDAKVDKAVFGRDRFLEQQTSGGITLPVELQIPCYTTEANADYEVLRHVREKWNTVDMNKFEYVLWSRWQFRLVASHAAGFTAYEPGDYSFAALLALGEPIG